MTPSSAGWRRRRGWPSTELTLDEFAEVTARVYVQLDSFAITPKAATDATFQAVDERRRAALLAAVAPYTEHWSEQGPRGGRGRARRALDRADLRAPAGRVGLRHGRGHPGRELDDRVLSEAIRSGPPPPRP